MGSRTELIEAAVLEGNNVDRELLISLSLLIEWDLLPSGFPNVTIRDYFTELLKPLILSRLRILMEMKNTKSQSLVRSVES